jgi:hypothetical protein
MIRTRPNATSQATSGPDAAMSFDSDPRVDGWRKLKREAG